MEELNTHGYKMVGLDAASDAINRYVDRLRGHYVEVSYNTVTGNVITRNFTGWNGDSNYTEWMDGETQRMYATYAPQTPQEIADQIDYWLMARDPKRKAQP